MEHSGLSASDVLALTRDNDCLGGGQFWWVIVFLIVAAMFNGNGFGFGNRDGATNALIGEDEFIKRDIFNTNQNVSNTACQTQRDVLENRYSLGSQVQGNKYDLGAQIQNNRYDLGSQIQENRFNCSQNACATQKEILQNRYDNALQTNTLQSQMQSCCCDLKAEGLANTQKILDKLCENEIAQLRTDLQSAQLQISQLSQTANITNTLRPFPQPAYITASPYQSYYGYGCGCNL